MMLLVSGATATMRRYKHRPHLGHLLTPQNRNSMATYAETGLPFGADNGCFRGFEPIAFERMLRRIEGRADNELLFVVAPDVYANAAATLALFEEWAPRLQREDLPIALVAQDGQERLPLPWGAFSTLFIGGSTAWKESDAARELAAVAHLRGVRVHVGRVNTIRREALYIPVGADTFDGSQYSMFPDRYIPWALARMDALEEKRQERIACWQP